MFSTELLPKNEPCGLGIITKAIEFKAIALVRQRMPSSRSSKMFLLSGIRECVSAAHKSPRRTSISTLPRLVRRARISYPWSKLCRPASRLGQTGQRGHPRGSASRSRGGRRRWASRRGSSPSAPECTGPTSSDIGRARATSDRMRPPVPKRVTAASSRLAPWGRFPHFSGRRRFEDDRDGSVAGMFHTGAGRVASRGLASDVAGRCIVCYAAYRRIPRPRDGYQTASIVYTGRGR